jgi:hypothetical protein
MAGKVHKVCGGCFAIGRKLDFFKKKIKIIARGKTYFLLTEIDTIFTQIFLNNL